MGQRLACLVRDDRGPGPWEWYPRRGSGRRRRIVGDCRAVVRCGGSAAGIACRQPLGSGEEPRTGTADASAAALLAPPLVASGSTSMGIDTPSLFMMASICVSQDLASELASAASPPVAEGGTAGLAPGGGLSAPPSEAALLLTAGMGGPTASARILVGEIWPLSLPPAAAAVAR